MTDARTHPVPRAEAVQAVRFLQHLLAAEYRHLRRLEAGRPDIPDGWSDATLPGAQMLTIRRAVVPMQVTGDRFDTVSLSVIVGSPPPTVLSWQPA